MTFGTGLMGRAMHAVCDFAALPHAVREAREFVSNSLREWACEPLIDTAVLLTSELVTNAIMHARTGPTVRMSLKGSALRIEVVDHGEGTPLKRTAAPEDVSGRGLALVEAMAARWGVIDNDLGTGGARKPKVVWFELSPAA